MEMISPVLFNPCLVKLLYIWINMNALGGAAFPIMNRQGNFSR